MCARPSSQKAYRKTLPMRWCQFGFPHNLIKLISSESAQTSFRLNNLRNWVLLLSSKKCVYAPRMHPSICSLFALIILIYIRILHPNQAAHTLLICHKWIRFIGKFIDKKLWTWVQCIIINAARTYTHTHTSLRWWERGPSKLSGQFSSIVWMTH